MQGDRQQAQHLHEADGRDPTGGPSELLDDDALRQPPHRAAADLLGKDGSDVPERAHARRHLTREALPALPLGDDGPQLAVDEAPYRLPDRGQL